MNTETKVTKIDKPTLRLVRPAIQAGLDEVGKKLGVDFQVGGISYSQDRFTMKVEAVLVGAAPTMQKNFETFARLYGFEPSDFGKTFEVLGVQYKIAGLNSRRTKHPLIATRLSDGKDYKFAADPIAQLLNKTKAKDTKPKEN